LVITCARKDRRQSRSGVGSRTWPLVLTWASTRPARVR
jgi:hypothetical protein